jgi:hypothetical protein
LAPKIAGSRQHLKRRRQREAAIVLNGQLPRAKTIQKYVQPAMPLPTTLVTESLRTMSCGYHVVPSNITDAQKVFTLVELLEKGFQLVAWDG